MITGEIGETRWRSRIRRLVVAGAAFYGFMLLGGQWARWRVPSRARPEAIQAHYARQIEILRRYASAGVEGGDYHGPNSLPFEDRAAFDLPEILYATAYSRQGTTGSSVVPLKGRGDEAGDLIGCFMLVPTADGTSNLWSGDRSQYVSYEVAASTGSGSLSYEMLFDVARMQD